MTTTDSEPKAIDLLWGAAAIGKVIGRTPKQVFHLLENGHIPPARKLGGKWVVSERQLRDFFETI